MILRTLDLAVLALYLAGMLLVGLRFARRQKTTEDYFLASRRMPWLAVGMSMFASLTSAVTYMGVPGAAYSENISLVVVCIVSPLLAPVLILLFYPFYDRLRVTTSYEYLERRFGRSARFAGSGLFVLARLGWVGTVVYAPALALSVASGLPQWVTILLMGVLATAYTVLGGMAADIWTDVVQFVIMLGGAVWIAVTLAAGVPHGVAGIWQAAAQAGRLHIADWRFDIHAMNAMVVGVTFFFQMMQDYGTDQVTVQRLLSIGNRRGITRAIMFNALTDFWVIGLLLFIGLGLYAWYQPRLGELPAGLSGDAMLPWYAVHALPPGAAGLLLAAIFAAAMSSMDSGINSLATVVTHDFVRPLRRTAPDERRDLALARWLTLAFGALATALAFFVSTLGGIIKAYTTFVSLFSAPVLALFLLGMLTRRGTLAGWVAGTAVSVPATLWLQHAVKAHWVYYFPFSFFVCLLIAWLVSMTLGKPPADPAFTVWPNGDGATRQGDGAHG